MSVSASAGLIVVWLLARSGVDVDLGPSVGLEVVVGCLVVAGSSSSASESEDQSTSSSSAGVDAEKGQHSCRWKNSGYEVIPFSISLLRCSSLSITWRRK